MRLSATIPALDQLLPAFVIQGGSANYNLATDVSTVNFSQDAMLNGLTQWIFTGLSRLASEAAELSRLVEDIPLIGDDLAPAMRSALQSGFRFDGPLTNVRAYLESKGVPAVLKLVTFDQLLSGNTGDRIDCAELQPRSKSGSVHSAVPGP